MIQKYIIVFIAIIAVITGCSTKTERVVESTYPDKSPQIVKYYKTAGEQRELVKEESFYPNKQKRMEGEYKKNERDGRWIYYYESGKIWSEGFFKNGKSEGSRITYFENGNKRYEGTYKNDLRTGVWKFYTEDGKPAEEIDYGKGTLVKEE
jgi:antitoxin component YwqK of YwqJK toxin-antitoxin module